MQAMLYILGCKTKVVIESFMTGKKRLGCLPPEISLPLKWENYRRLFSNQSLLFANQAVACGNSSEYAITIKQQIKTIPPIKSKFSA